MDTAPFENPIRIIHLISTLDVGGAELSLTRLVSSLESSRFSNTVVSLTTKGTAGTMLEECGIPVHALNMTKGMPDPRGIFTLSGIMNLYQPCIIQCWMYHANLLGLLFKKRRHVVWNIRCSDMDLNHYSMIYRLAVRCGALLSRLPESIIINSHAGLQHHENLGYKPRHWEIIPNGFDTELFKPDENARSRIRAELNIPEDSHVIGMAARLDPMKDHHSFFDAALLLQETHPDVHFVLAGSGITPINPEIAEYIQSSRNPSNFHLLGQRSDMPEVFNAIDIAISSSCSEGLPNTIGEAMATGIPCVVTDVGDSGMLVGDTGLVVVKADPGALCRAWQLLLDAGKGHLRALGKKARNRICDHYHLQAMVQSYENLYTELIVNTEIKDSPSIP